jgi:outer membrane protein insertion porin family
VQNYTLRLALLSGAAVLGSALASAAEPLAIARITVEGSVTVPAPDLLRSLTTRAGVPYDPTTLDADIKRLWETGRYNTVKWKVPTSEDGGIVLVLILEERPLLQAIEYRNRKRVDEATLTRVVEKAGVIAGEDRRYDDGAAFRAAEEIVRQYRSTFYFLATVRYFPESYEGTNVSGLPSVKLVFDINEGRPTPLKSVRFIGNRAYTDKQLYRFLKSITNAQGGGGFKGFDRLRFQRSVDEMQRLYRNSGYLDARVVLKDIELFTWDPPGAKEEKWLSPTIEITEGPIYTVGNVTLKIEKAPKGDEIELTHDTLVAIITAPAEEFEGQKPFTLGEPYSEQVEELAAKRVEKAVGYNGRIQTTVKRKHFLPQEGTQIDVEFTVVPSERYRLGGFSVRGNHKTKASVFVRELIQAGLKHEIRDRATGTVKRQGEWIDSRKLDLATRNIMYTGLVKDKRNEDTGEMIRAGVNIRPVPRDDETVDLYIDVNEAETGSLMIGASVNSNGELAGNIQFSQRNFNLFGLPRSGSDWTNAFTGAGQTLSISASFGTVTDVFQLEFEEPYFLGLPMRLGVDLVKVVKRREGYTDQRESVGISLGHSWSLHRYRRQRLAVTGKWRDEFVEISNVDEDSSMKEVVEGRVHIQRLGAAISYESRDSRSMPSQGSYLRLSHDVAGRFAGGDLEFTKTYAEYQHHIRVKKNKNEQPSVLQFKVSYSVAQPYGDTLEVPFYERYYAGGFGSLRGFDYRSVGPMDSSSRPLGGKTMFLGTLEYTYPLSADSSLRGAMFYDTGNVWAGASEADLSDLKQSTGIGLLIMPAGFPVPISLYLGWIINKEPEDDDQVVSFMIGHMFF